MSKKSGNIFVLLFLAIILSSCASHLIKPIPNYSPECFFHPDNKKGIVFLSITEDGVSLPFEIKKLDETVPYIVRGSHNIFGSNLPSYNKKNLLLLDPGIYYIDYISLLEINNTTRWFPSPGLEIRDGIGMVKYGMFEVIANQVLFLGNINYTMNGLELQTNTSLLEKQLAESSDHKILLTKLTQGKLYTKGSAIYLKDGKCRMIDVEEIRAWHLETIKNIINTKD